MWKPEATHTLDSPSPYTVLERLTDCNREIGPPSIPLRPPPQKKKIHLIDLFEFGSELSLAFSHCKSSRIQRYVRLFVFHLTLFSLFSSKGFEGVGQGLERHWNQVGLTIGQDNITQLFGNKKSGETIRKLIPEIWNEVTVHKE